MGNAYRDVFFTKSDPVIESFRNVRDMYDHSVLAGWGFRSGFCGRFGCSILSLRRRMSSNVFRCEEHLSRCVFVRCYKFDFGFGGNSGLMVDK